MGHVQEHLTNNLHLVLRDQHSVVLLLRCLKVGVPGQTPVVEHFWKPVLSRRAPLVITVNQGNTRHDPACNRHEVDLARVPTEMKLAGPECKRSAKPLDTNLVEFRVMAFGGTAVVFGGWVMVFVGWVMVFVGRVMVFGAGAVVLGGMDVVLGGGAELMGRDSWWCGRCFGVVVFCPFARPTLIATSRGPGLSATSPTHSGPVEYIGRLLRSSLCGMLRCPYLDVVEQPTFFL